MCARGRRKDRVGDLREHRDALARPCVDLDSQVGDAEKENDGNRRHHQQRLRRVRRLGATEGVDTVCDRLYSCQGARPRGKRSQEDERSDRACAGRDLMGNDRVRWGAHDAFDEADSDEHEHRDDEAVGRQCERDPALPDAAEVDERDGSDREDTQLDVPARQGRDGGGNREDSAGHRDRDGQHVIDQQRRGRDEGRDRPEVVHCDDVGAAARLVGTHDLRVRECDDPEQDRDHDREREDEVKRGRRNSDEDDHRGFCRVRDRADRVRREDRQRQELREQGVLELPRRPRTTDEDPLQERRPANAAAARRLDVHPVEPALVAGLNVRLARRSRSHGTTPSQTARILRKS